MKLLRYGWNLAARAYYGRAVRSLGRQGRAYSPDWFDAFWLRHRADEIVRGSFR